MYYLLYSSCQALTCSPVPFPFFSYRLFFQKVMELLESKVGSGLFLEGLTEVNMNISRKRVERKRQRAVEKATDPVAAAERRKDRTAAGKVRFANPSIFFFRALINNEDF